MKRGAKDKYSISQPLSELIDDEVRSLFRFHAKTLFEDLQSHCLEVILIPAPDPRFSGHKIRAVECQNPVWYSYLFEQYEELKRIQSLHSLQRLAEGRDRVMIPYKKKSHQRSFHYSYDELYRGVCKEHLINGYTTGDREWMPPSNEARIYFNLKPAKLNRVEKQSAIHRMEQLREVIHSYGGIPGNRYVQDVPF